MLKNNILPAIPLDLQLLYIYEYFMFQQQYRKYLQEKELEYYKQELIEKELLTLN